ncbi:uncharacterized protein BDR25DRAFT_363319 [Lindgomyces ingoldianus]|uniref:Uncharacterized protein n=1 Tax=Lindgomyces ingoldianus TaxID=673940 RepID=A0ACB6Q7U3_9PLEO|nr:uncharacterized protein BDR25DRAFT_363319 [Lindgomyces ingoldianus]KAF2462917.1 hypothetical protein BDR25DRAFT_363319 [Lindgomyces ingoldianus]
MAIVRSLIALNCDNRIDYLRSLPHSQLQRSVKMSQTFLFYRTRIETKKPGSVLKVRTVPGNPVDDYRTLSILYRTTDSNEKPTYAVTTAFHNYDPPTLMIARVIYIIHNDTYMINIGGFNLPEEISQGEEYIKAYLEQGWFVNFPDYEGATAAFDAGRMAGYATLDSIRATLSTICAIGIPKPMLYDPPRPKVVMYSYSGGSIATRWAAIMQATYASELNISGAGVGGLFPNIKDTIGNLPGFYIRSLIKGLATMHLEAQPVAMNVFGNVTWDHAVDRLKYPLNLEKPMVQKLRHGTPKIPSFFHHADADGYSTTKDTQQLRDDYCQQSAIVYLHVNNAIPTVLPASYSHMLEGIAASGSQKFVDIVERYKELLKLRKMQLDPRTTTIRLDMTQYQCSWMTCSILVGFGEAMEDTAGVQFVVVSSFVLFFCLALHLFWNRSSYFAIRLEMYS